MNIAFLGILVMALLPYVWVGLAKFGGKDKFNNATPRIELAKLTGWRQRANWAQLNQFEVLPLFIAGVIIAIYNHAPHHILNLLVVNIVILRIIYGILYIQGLAILRSLVWFISLGLMIAMFFI